MPNEDRKNIILCADGTGNSGAKWHGTNVWRLYKAVDRHDHEAKPNDLSTPRQIVFYDQGVGTSNLNVLKLLGGAFGVGLSRNIRELYTSLTKNYDLGDRIFLFGFSRGAFTVRSLAAMISEVGVIDGRRDNEELEALVSKAYKAYRSKPVKNAIQKFKDDCRRKHIDVRDARIHFVGVWDTVDAIGVPVDGLRNAIYKSAAWFRRPHNDQITGKMDHVYQALAIDEERRTFDPNMYFEPATRPDGSGPRIEQVWFAGAHSNVGGGYPRQGMSDVAGDWMMVKAEDSGIRFAKTLREEFTLERDVHSTLYDPRTGPSAYYRYCPRNIQALCDEASATPKIHVTVMDRIELATDGYAPTNLPADFEVVGTRKEDQERVDDYNRCVRSTVARRSNDLKDAWGIATRRKVLYFGFLAASLALVALAIAILIDEPKVVEAIRTGPTISWVLLAAWEQLPEPVRGISATAFNWVRTILAAILPESVSTLARGLLMLPGVVLVALVLGFILKWIRKRLIRQMKHMGLKAWRTTFRAHRVGAQPPTPAGLKADGMTQ